MKALATEDEQARKRNTVISLHLYSDLSVEEIAHQVDMEVDEVQDIIDALERRG